MKNHKYIHTKFLIPSLGMNIRQRAIPSNSGELICDYRMISDEQCSGEICFFASPISAFYTIRTCDTHKKFGKEDMSHHYKDRLVFTDNEKLLNSLNLVNGKIKVKRSGSPEPESDWSFRSALKQISIDPNDWFKLFIRRDDPSLQWIVRMGKCLEESFFEKDVQLLDLLAWNGQGMSPEHLDNLLRPYLWQ